MMETCEVCGHMVTPLDRLVKRLRDVAEAENVTTMVSKSDAELILAILDGPQ